MGNKIATLCGDCLNGVTNSTQLPTHPNNREAFNPQKARVDTDRQMMNPNITKTNPAGVKKQMFASVVNKSSIETANYGTKIKNEDTKESQLQASRPMKSRVVNARSSALQQQEFLKSREYAEARSGNKDIQALVKVAAQANQVELYSQSQQIYTQALRQLQQSRNEYNSESVQNILLFIHVQLFSIALQKNDLDGSMRQFKQSLKLYEQMNSIQGIDEKVVLMNNFAVICKKHKKYSQAIKICQQAIILENKYFINHDQRKYLTLLNLACIYFESGNIQEGKKVTDKILSSCPRQFSDIKDLAVRNRKFYAKS